MKVFVFSLLCFIGALYAAPEIATSSPTTAALVHQTAHSTMLIDPKMRALDFVHAFELLHKDKPTQKINLQTSAGTLMNIGEMSVADNGTLLFVKVPFNQGVKYAIVPIEEVEEIVYSP
ncbi:MAG: hypothetical protein HY861_04355 [Chlamydiia bacterium]|nr:hypothetical protein [Chlamydiia bacterium]